MIALAGECWSRLRIDFANSPHLLGTIGTGLFLGSGKSITYAGPLGALMGYTFVGALVVAPVFSIAEMSALVPLTGGLIRHAEYFVDPALSFAAGWNVSIPTSVC